MKFTIVTYERSFFSKFFFLITFLCSSCSLDSDDSSKPSIKNQPGIVNATDSYTSEIKEIIEDNIYNLFLDEFNEENTHKETCLKLLNKTPHDQFTKDTYEAIKSNNELYDYYLMKFFKIYFHYFRVKESINTFLKMTDNPSDYDMTDVEAEELSTLEGKKEFLKKMIYHMYNEKSIDDKEKEYEKFKKEFDFSKIYLSYENFKEKLFSYCKDAGNKNIVNALEGSSVQESVE